MTENSLNLEFESISLPKAKRQRREVPKESLCEGIKSNGNQCSFSCLKGSLYCKKHTPKSILLSAETNTCNVIMVDSSTNTEVTMMDDIITANNVILDLIDDRVEHEKQIEEFLEIYRFFQRELEILQLI